MKEGRGLVDRRGSEILIPPLQIKAPRKISGIFSSLSRRDG